jgi:DNA polymerase III subunit gamma/tau
MAKKPKDDPGAADSVAPSIAPAAPIKAPQPMAGTPDKPYVVLARKYRPRTFEDMIGQDALVQTLRNGFASGRIAQGYMLTGVRGIGKTTTARILARALNYETDSVT